MFNSSELTQLALACSYAADAAKQRGHTFAAAVYYDLASKATRMSGRAMCQTTADNYDEAAAYCRRLGRK